MFSSEKIAGVMNGVLSQKQYKVAIDELKKRVNSYELENQLANTFLEKSNNKEEKDEVLEH